MRGLLEQGAGQGCEPDVEVRVFDAEPAELSERPFDLLTLGLAGAGDGVAVRAAVRGSWVHDGDFAELVAVKGLLQGAEGALPAAATGSPYVGAQLPDLLVLMMQDGDDVWRDHSLESLHDRPLCVEKTPGSGAMTLPRLRAQRLADWR
jgi:hypothetical protein